LKLRVEITIIYKVLAPFQVVGLGISEASTVGGKLLEDFFWEKRMLVSCG